MTTVTARKGTFDAALNNLKPGDTLAVVEDIIFPFATPHRWGKRVFSEPVTVDLGGNTLAGLYWGALEGVNFMNGNLFEFRADSSRRLGFRDMRSHGAQTNKGVQVVRGSDVQVENVEFSDLARGLQFTLVDRIRVTRSDFARMHVDGAEFGECHTWEFSRNTGRDFRPAAGTHADLVQGWSRAGSPPSSDIRITDNYGNGPMQGIGLFDHAPDDRPPDGGFDRVYIARNNMCAGFAHGIALTNGRDSVLENNDVSTFEWQPPPINGVAQKLNRASINVSGGSVTWRGLNIAHAGAGKREQIYPV